jgi:hypothetical protein
MPQGKHRKQLLGEISKLDVIAVGIKDVLDAIEAVIVSASELRKNRHENHFVELQWRTSRQNQTYRFA